MVKVGLELRLMLVFPGDAHYHSTVLRLGCGRVADNTGFLPCVSLGPGGGICSTEYVSK